MKTITPPDNLRDVIVPTLENIKLGMELEVAASFLEHKLEQLIHEKELDVARRISQAAQEAGLSPQELTSVEDWKTEVKKRETAAKDEIIRLVEALLQNSTIDAPKNGIPFKDYEAINSIAVIVQKNEEAAYERGLAKGLIKQMTPKDDKWLSKMINKARDGTFKQIRQDERMKVIEKIRREINSAWYHNPSISSYELGLNFTKYLDNLEQ